MTRPGTANPAVIDVVTAAETRVRWRTASTATGTTTAMATTLATTPSHAVVHAGVASDAELVPQRLRPGLVGVGDGPPRPLPQRDHRDDQGETEDDHDECCRRQLPASERHGSTTPRRRAGAPVERPAHSAFDDDDGESHHDEDRRRRERRRPIGESRGVHDAGQRVEAEQLHGAELAEAVEHDEQGAAGDRRRGRAGG